VARHAAVTSATCRVLVNDLAGGRDHIRSAIGVLGLGGEHGVIGLGDALVGIGCHRKLIAAFAHGELVERVDGIVRDPDDRGAEGLEFVRGLGELVGLDGAARRECRGIKIQYDRTVLECIGQGKLERLAGESRLGGEIRGLDAGLQCRVQGRSQHRAA
jgi:hypothetical protein